MYPIASTVWRVAKDATELGGYRIPAGVVVASSVLNYQIDPRLWGRDAHEFRCVRAWRDFERGMRHVTERASTDVLLHS